MKKNQKQQREKKLVTSEFHLELDEAKKLFKEFKTPLNQNVGVVYLNPVNTSAIKHLDKNTIEKKQKELRDKGVLIVSISPKINNPIIKEGDIVLFTNPNAIQFDKKKSINIQGVFPSKREYTYMILDYHSLLQIIEKPEVKIEQKLI